MFRDCTLFKESVRAFINDAPSEEIQSITKQLNEQPSLADTETLELEFWSSMPSSSGLGDGLS
jgi:hypothetical protein